MRYAFALIFAGLLSAPSVFADSLSSSTAGGVGDRKAREFNVDAQAANTYRARHFSDRHRRAVFTYYWQEFHRGSCPPGLTRNSSGCTSPIRIRKWRIGRPLPRDVIAYELPAELAAHLPLPESGSRYVRVEADILLIGLRNGVVVDAIEDSRGVAS
jgi:Ni/Co efflux regulator RcnB